MKFGVVVFPGSNCDQDCYYAIELLGEDVSYIWHEEEDLSSFDCLILPGGFSYGDYLRTGAIARFSPVMKAVKEFADRGGLVIGICNGFQILLESHLLPGAMLVNKNLKFICRYVYLRVENNETPFTFRFKKGDVLRIPIAHYAGNYYAPQEILDELERNNQVVLRYCDENGRVTEEANPNGSVGNIAGIVNGRGNVFGLMPHPERAMEPLLHSEDGKLIFLSVVDYLNSLSLKKT
jgi:phosphoribosylformylglycinamidine synthase